MLKDAGTGFSRPATTTQTAKDVFRVPVEAIIPDPENARQYFDEEELQALADNLKRVGQLQNAVAFPEGERYTLVAGERRWRACKLAGIPTLNCLVLPRDLALEVRHEMALAENVCRSDLKPTEVAKRWQALMERWNVSGSELAKRLGVAQSTVSKKLGLLKLDAATQAAIDAGQVGEETARRQAEKPTAGKLTTSTTKGEKRKINYTEFNTRNGVGRLKRGGTLRGLIAELEELARNQEPAAAA
jgi:ParB/RepB/Spo0J family partition protein